MTEAIFVLYPYDWGKPSPCCCRWKELKYGTLTITAGGKGIRKDLKHKENTISASRTKLLIGVFHWDICTLVYPYIKASSLFQHKILQLPANNDKKLHIRGRWQPTTVWAHAQDLCKTSLPFLPLSLNTYCKTEQIVPEGWNTAVKNRGNQFHAPVICIDSSVEAYKATN